MTTPGGSPPPPVFEQATRQKFTRLAPITYPANGGLSPAVELPKTGFLARIWLSISITVGGTVNTPNPAGIASAIRRIRVFTNNGIDLYNVSGVGNGYLFQNFQEFEGINGRQPKNQYNTAVSAASFNLDMVVPIMLNLHDPVGLVLLQNEQLQIQLSVEWETPTGIGGSTATVATGAGASVTPMLEFFSVPPDPRSYPPRGYLQQIIEDQFVVTQTSGDYLYNIPRGNIYLQLLFGYGIKATAVDNWTRSQLRVNQNDYLADFLPGSVDQLVGYRQNLTRGLGMIAFDFLGSDGMGTLGSARDFIDTRKLTDFQALITVSAADTLYVIRRMLVPLE